MFPKAVVAALMREALGMQRQRGTTTMGEQIMDAGKAGMTPSEIGARSAARAGMTPNGPGPQCAGPTLAESVARLERDLASYREMHAELQRVLTTVTLERDQAQAQLYRISGLG